MNSTFVSPGLTAALFWVSVGSIFYTYFGYPLLIFFLARLFRRPFRLSKSDAPGVTLLIAAYNEEAVIRDKIRNSLDIDYPHDRYQILVVTDGSSDSTAERVAEFAARGVELLHEAERRGKMAAINRALPHARGEVVVFSDANNFYGRETLQRLVAPFGDTEVGAVSGAKMVEQDEGSLAASEGLYWKYESFIKKQESALGSCTSASGEILALRRSAYRRPPDNIINDDFYIAMQAVRQGYRLVYVPEATSWERVSPTPKDELVRRTRINAGRYQSIAMAGEILPFNRPVLVWQILSHKFLRPLVPFFMISAMIFNVLAVLNPPASHAFWLLGMPWSAILLGFQVLFYGMAWLGTRYAGAKRKGRFMKLLYLPSFLTNSNLAALQGLAKYLRGGQFHIWERIQRG
ncbi:MAG: glycosyltransferase family 2 protein [Bacteroidota bacterium]